MKAKIISNYQGSKASGGIWSRMVKGAFPWAFEADTDKLTAERIVLPEPDTGPLNGTVLVTDVGNMQDQKKIGATVAQVNEVIRQYLALPQVGFKLDGPEAITVLTQFNVVYTNPQWAYWHTLGETEQRHELQLMNILPHSWPTMIDSMNIYGIDPFLIDTFLQEVYQNAVDSFSMTANGDQKYRDRFPGFKLLIFSEKKHGSIRLILADNGYGKKFEKPGADFLGRKFSRPKKMFPSLSSSLFRKKDLAGHPANAGMLGGQGHGFNRLKEDYQLTTNLYLLGSGAVVESVFPPRP